jgi:hypothetical protein
MPVTEFQFKTYRVEWQVQLGDVDQYGQNFTPYEVYPFPTREEAKAFLPEVAVEHSHVKERYVPKKGNNGYREARISYKEVEIVPCQ